MPKIINPLSRVETDIVSGTDGKVEGFIETQPREQTDMAATIASHFADNAKPLAGNTQRHMRHVAEIPNVIVNDLMRREIWGDQKKMLQWLETDGRCYKSFQGRLS